MLNSSNKALLRSNLTSIKRTAAITLALACGACSGHTPTGQVVATVNGQEITTQDLQAEARGLGGVPDLDPKMLLQHVLARVVLAQSAHQRKLDAYPGYPSDVARLQQTFLAQKAVQVDLKPKPKPTTSDLARFEAAHPYLFNARQNIKLDEVRFQPSADMKELTGVDDMASLTSRLQKLNMTAVRQTVTIDTSSVPEGLAEKMATVPIGQLFYVKQKAFVVGMTVDQREPVNLSAEQKDALAAHLLVQTTNQEQIDADVKRLMSERRIVYQHGYEMPASTSPSHSDASK